MNEQARGGSRQDQNPKTTRFQSVSSLLKVLKVLGMKTVDMEWGRKQDWGKRKDYCTRYICGATNLALTKQTK